MAYSGCIVGLGMGLGDGHGIVGSLGDGHGAGLGVGVSEGQGMAGSLGDGHGVGDGDGDGDGVGDGFGSDGFGLGVGDTVGDWPGVGVGVGDAVGEPVNRGASNKLSDFDSSATTAEAIIPKNKNVNAIADMTSFLNTFDLLDRKMRQVGGLTSQLSFSLSTRRD